MTRFGPAIGVACVAFLACGLAAAGPHADRPPGTMVISRQIEGGAALFVSRADGSDAVQIRNARRTAAYRWLPDSSKLFEYVSPPEAGWVVRDARGRLRVVSVPAPGGDWRCA